MVFRLVALSPPRRRPFIPATIAQIFLHVPIFLSPTIVVLAFPPSTFSPFSLFRLDPKSSCEIMGASSRTTGLLKSIASNYDDDAVLGDHFIERKRAKLGRVPIISRTICVEAEISAASTDKGYHDSDVRRDHLDNIKNEVDKESTDLSEQEPNHENIQEASRNTTFRLTRSNRVKSLEVTVWEMEKPSKLIQTWWSLDKSERSSSRNGIGDPFGVVMWPGSIVAARELLRRHNQSILRALPSPLQNATVLILGAGTGVEAQTALLLGAKKVIATDINPLTISLLEYGCKRMVEKYYVDEKHDKVFEGVIQGKYFDIFSNQPLPQCDILIAADILYNSELSKQVGHRIHEALSRPIKSDYQLQPKIIITDSQRFHGTNFLVESKELQEWNAIRREHKIEELHWEMQSLKNVRGSGVLIDEDQVYDADVRVISWGWEIATDLYDS